MHPEPRFPSQPQAWLPQCRSITDWPLSCRPRQDGPRCVACLLDAGRARYDSTPYHHMHHPNYHPHSPRAHGPGAAAERQPTPPPQGHNPGWWAHETSPHQQRPGVVLGCNAAASVRGRRQEDRPVLCGHQVGPPRIYRGPADDVDPRARAAAFWPPTRCSTLLPIPERTPPFQFVPMPVASHF
jgi:hypothetical protein